jgi:hypothetical protein
MIRVDYDGDPHGMLVLVPRLLGWTAEVRPLAGEPNLGTRRVWHLFKWAAASAAVHQLDDLDPTTTWIKRNMYRGLTAALDAQLLHGTGTSPGPQGIIP